ncbi:MAG: carbohydrate binding domain-containing protein [Prevotella sp.]|nr:carbohydrate binding domain-containing protein [Prevotella sp.]
MKKSLLLILAIAFTLVAKASTIDDVIDQSVTGITSTTYTDFGSLTGTSGTVYTGQCAGSHSSVQLRSDTDKGCSGVVVTSSIGYARKVVVDWETDTTNGRTLNVYGKNSAYESADDLYNSDEQGSLLGTIVYGTSTELEIDGDYAYIGFRSASGAMYLTSITITWETVGDTYVAQPVVTPSSGTYYEAQTVSMTASDGCTIYYTVNGGDEQEYTSEFTLSDTGTYTIAAYAKDESGTTSSTTTVEIVIEEPITSCADLRTACDEGGATASSTAPTAVFKFSDLLVTGVYGSYVFVSDDDASFLLYGSNSGLTKGDKISGTVEGLLYTYSGLRELSVSDWSGVTTESTGNTVEAAAVAIDTVIENYDTYEGAYVEFAGVTLQSATVEDKYLAIEDTEGGEIKIYDTGNLLTGETYDTSATYNVFAYVVRYNTTVQVYVLDASDIQIVTDKTIAEGGWAIDGETVTSETIYVGATATAVFTTTSNGNVTYTSDSETIATVTEDGVITGVAAGSATITATVAETDTYTSVIKSITITVKNELGGLETFTNGGFEEWTDENTPIDWVSSTAATNCTVVQSTDAHGGNYAVQIPHSSSNNRMGSREYLLSAGTYNVTFFVKSADADNLAHYRAGYAVVDEDGTINGSTGYIYTDFSSSAEEAPADWEEESFSFTLSEETTVNLVIMNHNGGSGALLVDDYSIVLGEDNGDEEENNGGDETTIGGLETFVNGGFEEWEDDTTPVGWVSTTTASSSGKVTKSEDAHSGNYAAKITHNSSNNRLATKELLLPAGTYLVNYYAKSVDAEGLAVVETGYAPWDEEKEALGNYKYSDEVVTVPADEWTYIEWEFTLEEDTQVNLVIMCNKSGGGDVLIDDYNIGDDPTGITSVKTGAELGGGAMYNLSGQKVTDSYKGIVIVNGRKVLKK